MDSLTLLIVLNVLIGLSLIFSIVIAGRRDSAVSREWIASYLFLFAGFFLLLFQGSLPPLVSIVIANLFIVLGFYFQVPAALNLEYGNRLSSRYPLLLILPIFGFLFLIYTYVDFNTSMRIVVISAFLSAIYFYGFLMLFRGYRRNRYGYRATMEILYIFAFSALFYLFRLIATLQGMGSVQSLFDTNLITTMSLIVPILASQAFLMGIFNATIRQRSRQIAAEKEKFSYLFEFLNDTAGYLDLDDLYAAIEKVLRQSLKVDVAAIYIRDRNTESHSINYSFDYMNLGLDELRTLGRGEGISGRAIETNRIVDMNTDEYPIPSVVEKLKARDVERLISIPLRTSEGVMGAISLLYSRLMMKVRLDEDFFYFLGEQIGLVLQNAYLFRQVKQLADTDSLTGLYTRRKMRDRMEYEVRRVNRSRGQFTLAMADLDDFKHINDTHGHDCGDEVLRTAAAVMQRECRDTDSLCRWGGEEFLILFADTGPEAAAVVAERIRLAFAASEAACAPGKTITLSLGLAASNPELSLDEVISRADAALYEAKKAGKNRVVVPPAGESPS